MRPIKQVPNSWSGVSRRTYQHAYSKGITHKVKQALGANKLTTPALGKSTTAAPRKSGYVAPPLPGDVSFGATGNVEPDFYGPLK